MEEFIPTLGNLIKKCDTILKDISPTCYDLYAKGFEGTMIERVIFSGKSFEEAASEYCREQGWKEPR